MLVRRESLPGSSGSPPRVTRPGERAKAAGRRPHRGEPRPHRRGRRRARHRRPRRALRGDLRHHRRRGRPARGQRGRHPRGDRPGPSAGRHAASRVVDRGRRHLSRRVHRGRLRRRAGSADAVSPDQVRGRAVGPLGGGTALPGVSARGRGRRLPHRRNGQDRRPVLLLRPAGEAGRVAQVHPDGAARHRPHQHRSGGLCGGGRRRTHARRRSRRADLPPHRPENHWAARHLPGVAEAAGLPPLRGSLPGATATPFLRATGRAKVLRNMAATQLGIPGEILDVVDLAPTFTSANTEKPCAAPG